MLVTPDLMESSVLHGIGVVMIINDIKIFNSISFGRSFELHLWFILACSLREDGEMGWNIDLNACKTGLCQLKRIYLGLKVLMLLLTPTCLFSPGPSALTLPASWEGSTLTLNGLVGISCVKQRRVWDVHLALVYNWFLARSKNAVFTWSARAPWWCNGQGQEACIWQWRCHYHF